MNLYKKKQHYKILLAIAGLLIVVASLWYANIIVKKIAVEERKKIELWAGAINQKANLVKNANDLFRKIASEERKKIEIWAEATLNISKINSDSDVSFYLKIISSNTTIPVIVTNQEGKIIFSRNIIDSLTTDSAYIKHQIQLVKTAYPPIEVTIGDNKKQYLYYYDSHILSNLRKVMNNLIESFFSEVVANSASVPVILTDSTQQHIVSYGNIDIPINQVPSDYVRKLMNTMKLDKPPIKVQLDNTVNYIFYKDSYLLTQLRYYPFIQFLIIGIFLIIAYYLFSTMRNAEQNQVWVGMSKETAHQLGTPISSLLAWIEYIKLKKIDDNMIIDEIEKDVKRLEIIAQRFSKIGSQPELIKTNCIAILNSSIEYIKTRSSENVKFIINYDKTSEIIIPLNIPLFEWAIENVLTNAIDAMDSTGTIEISLSDHVQVLYIDIKDTGKGIPKTNYKTIFEPGYTTKPRGWGLGLSLTKRIIEYYHKGKIFVKSSEIGVGTTMRIALKK